MLSTLPLSFVTVVETGSITRAADELNIAKSAVSQNLKRLEEQLDVKLAIRTTRHLSLTPAGERYYQRCKEILALAQQAETEMESFGATPSGPITITAPHALIAPVIAPALATVKQKFPNLEPSVIAEDKRLNLITEGIDVAISVGQLPDSTLHARRVGTLRDVLCAAPFVMQDAPASDDPLYWQWVQALPYIAHMREPAVVNHRLQISDHSEYVDLSFRSAIKANTIEAIAAFARNGLGIALLPDIGIAQDLMTGHLQPLSGLPEPEPIPIYAVHSYDTLPPKSVQETITAIQLALAKVLP
ncbi:LysR family transcriptional regulator [Pseudovibrio japonicus]|uniref:LysR family transcriptional regulator n=1 Tax=Pseudovibrio japonicus TaxID=366534 RepID=A0ABQ3EKQ3_9HYPH|nr:LysR family transcriptional regulator [Pseudovibrio japonicus]GHB44569.1 LysR family transcriptional regulator [Pseudovibrio japonicus]